jgi:acetyl-CoA acetyltransferase family protein
MGGTAEKVAERFKVSRSDMDAFSVESHRKARAADFAAETVAVDKLTADEGPRADSSVEKLATLKPAFKADGVITAGNASQISDGAAALVLMSERALKERKATPLARISGYAVAGVEPQWVLVSTIDAVRKFDQRNPWPAAKADLVEINEAFAVSTVAAIRELGLDAGKVNADGGAIALGHPIGASGARIVVTLLNSLAKRGLKRGLATLCMGGGNGLALGVERP